MTGAEPTAEPTTPQLTAVVVNWNGGETLVRCLESLAANPPSLPWEVIVVDNASSDGSVELLRTRTPWARVIANSTNRGLAPANNQGLLASAAPWMLIANPDILFQPRSVDALIATLERHPRAAFAIARLCRPDGSVQTAAGDLPTLREALLGRQVQQARSATSGFWWDGWPHDEERAIGHGMEACYLVRRDALADIGPQDERFPLDWEGIDWSATAHERGWEIWFSPDAEVVHLGGVSLRQAEAAWVVRSHRGMYRYFAKRRGPAWRPVLAAAIGARGLAKLAAVYAGAGMYSRAHPGAVAPDDPHP